MICFWGTRLLLNHRKSPPTNSEQMTTYEKLKQLLDEEYAISGETISPESKLGEDLGFDSIDMMEFHEYLEIEFSLNPIMVELNLDATLGDVVGLIDSLLESKVTKYTPKTHDLMVWTLAKDGAEIKAELTDAEAHLWHMATGVAGEAGELLDAIKKAVVYRKPLDWNNVVEELGDLEFYMSGIRQAVNVSREEILAANIDKLMKRHHKGVYSNQTAIERADKQ